MTAPLTASGVVKRYGTHVVLDGVDLHVASGETVALLGPNGTGKSTLLGCVSGLVIPDAGRIEIAGHDLRGAPLEARKHLRVLPQEVEVPHGLTGREWLRFHAEVHGAGHDLERAVALAELGEAIDHLVSSYSVGMRRRVGFAALLPGRGTLYLLDEPFAGMDRDARARALAFLQRLKADGAGLVIAAHDADRDELTQLGAREFALG